MSLQPNQLLRTKRGLGGIRLLDHPGVFYPKSVLVAAPGMHPNTGKPYRKPPANTISSAGAAALFGICTSAMRLRLHRHKVRFYFVRESVRAVTLYWSLRQVQALHAKVVEFSATPPRGMVDWRRAIEMLPCSRTSLQRHARNGRVRVRRLRGNTASGTQTICYYNVADLKKLRTYLLFCADQEREARERFGRRPRRA